MVDEFVHPANTGQRQLRKLIHQPGDQLSSRLDLCRSRNIIIEFTGKPDVDGTCNIRDLAVHHLHHRLGLVDRAVRCYKELIKNSRQAAMERRRNCLQWSDRRRGRVVDDDKLDILRLSLEKTLRITRQARDHIFDRWSGRRRLLRPGRSRAVIRQQWSLVIHRLGRR